jgi:hypothetical protein
MLQINHRHATVEEKLPIGQFGLSRPDDGRATRRGIWEIHPVIKLEKSQ